MNKEEYIRLKEQQKEFIEFLENEINEQNDKIESLEEMIKDGCDYKKELWKEKGILNIIKYILSVYRGKMSKWK